jgi:hypothetical protein
MAALAEVVDESIAGMSRTMVTKAEQEKVSTFNLDLDPHHLIAPPGATASLHAKSRLRTAQVGATTAREERLNPHEARKRSTKRRRRKAQTTSAGGNHSNDGRRAFRPELGKGQDTR